MSWTVYILISCKTGRTYVGYSNDVEKRLKQHNVGSVKSTKHGIPWSLLYFEQCENISEANDRERYFKSGAGRRKLKQIYNHFKGEPAPEGRGLAHEMSGERWPSGLLCEG